MLISTTCAVFILMFLMRSPLGSHIYSRFNTVLKNWGWSSPASSHDEPVAFDAKPSDHTERSHDAAPIRDSLILDEQGFNTELGIRSLSPGEGIAVSSGHNPVIRNTGVLSLGGKTGTIYLDDNGGILFDNQKLYNADKGSSQNIFKTFKVSGEADVKADSNSTNLTLVAGTGMNIDTNNDEKTITFTNTSNSGWTDDGTIVHTSTSTDKVGVGTDNPTSLFSVGSSSGFQVDSSGNIVKINAVAYSFPSSQGAADTFLKNDGSGGLSWATNSFSIAADSLDFTDFADSLTLDAATTVAQGGNNFSFSGSGNVGVGTTNPSFKLDVNGIVNATALYVNSSPYIGSQWTTSGSNIYYASGNVGVGTTSPSYLFSAGSLSQFGVNSSGAIAAATGITSSGTITFSGLGSGIVKSTSGVLSNAVAGTDYAAPLTFTNGLTNSSNTVTLGGTLTQNTTLVNSSFNFNITGSGNVGIGTTSPTTKLHIVGDVRVTGAYYDSSNSAGSSTNILTSTGTGTAWSSIASAINSSAFVQGGNSFGTLATLGTNDNNSLGIRTSGVERVRIDTNGNIGIGTTSPLNKLHVVGNGTYAASFMSGNVGIGTTSPSGKLDITDTSNTAATFSLTNNTATTIGNGANTLGVLDLQSTSLTTGTFMNIELNALTSGKGLNLTSTSTGLSTGNLFNLDWSPTAATTATGDLFVIGIGSSGTVGNILNIKDSGSSLFSISESQMTSNIPASFAAAGDTSFAYDINLTNDTSATIKSYGPLYISAGETHENNDVTVRTYNYGNIVLDPGKNGGVLINQNIATSGTPTLLTLAGATHTGLTSATEMTDVNFNLYRAVQFTAGNIGTQRAMRIQGPIYGFTSASTISNASLLELSGAPSAGTNATITTSSALRIASAVAVGGTGTVTNAYGLYVDAPTGATNNYAATFASGNVGIGTTRPASQLQVIGNGTYSALFMSGNMGVGTTAPAKTLHVGSAAVADGTALIRLQDTNSTCDLDANMSAPLCGSDSTLKKDISSINGSLDLIKKLRPIQYRWKTDPESAGLHSGFIAQEVEQVLPEFVKDGVWTDGSTKKFLSMGGFIPYLVGAIKEQQIQIDALRIPEEKTASLSSRLAFLEDKLLSSPPPVLGIATSSALLSFEQTATASALTVTGKTNLYDLGVTGTYTSGLLTIQGLDDSLSTPSASINTIGGPLRLQSNALADIDIMNGKITIDTQGNLYTVGHVKAKTIQAENLETEYFKITQIKDGENVIGEATIQAGKSEVTVKNVNMQKNAAVFITPKTSTGGQPLTLKNKQDGSFVIAIEKGIDTDIWFDYWIVQVAE